MKIKDTPLSPRRNEEGSEFLGALSRLSNNMTEHTSPPSDQVSLSPTKQLVSGSSASTDNLYPQAEPKYLAYVTDKCGK